MPKMKSLMSAALLAGGALFLSSPAQSGILPASDGSAWDPSRAPCFHKGWNEPGQVTFQGTTGACNLSATLWDMPVPMSSTGSKTFSVYARNTTPFTMTCGAYVLSADGTTARWDELTVTSQQWYPFDSLTVNSNESVVIECNVINSVYGISWVGAVKGF
jgi:hypothetical protein